MSNGIRTLAVCLLAVSVLSHEPAAALENGKPDRGQLAVGVLGFVPALPGFDKPLAFCTGFVISDAAVVTAAHCIAAFAAIAESFHFTNEAGSAWEPVVEPGVVDLAAPGIPFPELLADTVSPLSIDFCGSGNFPALIVPDVAVLTFPAGTFDVPPVHLPRPGFVDELAIRGVLETIPAQLVGYGASAEMGTEVFVPGYRQRGLGKLSDPVPDPAVDPGGMTRAWIILRADAIFDTAALPGDSGGPMIVQGTAVALKGRPLGLSNRNAYQRLDTLDVLGCLSPYLAP